MPTLKEKLTGEYEISYIRTACSKPRTDVFKRIELKGPPFICRCFKKTEGAHPDLVIPLENTLSIHEVTRDARATAQLGQHVVV